MRRVQHRAEQRVRVDCRGGCRAGVAAGVGWPGGLPGQEVMGDEQSSACRAVATSAGLGVRG